MAQRYACPTVLIVLALGLLSLPAGAQIEDNVLGLSDENLEGYVSPLSTGLSGTMNAAIFRTGYVPQQRFELSVGLAAMAIGYDDEDRLYRPTDPEGFQSLEQKDVPTIVGPSEGVLVPGESNLTRAYPGGFDLEGFEIAVPQLSIGSYFGTRAIVRYVAMDLGDADLGNFSYVGFGLQHSITQWFSHAPVDLAAGFLIQDFEIGEDIVAASAMHLNLTASRQFGILQPYVGLGYDSMELAVKAEDEEDPELSIDFTLEDESNAHLTLGLLARVAVVDVFFEFNAAAATGFALGFDLGTMGGASHEQATGY